MPRRGYIPKKIIPGCKATVFINQNKTQLTIYPQVMGLGANPTKITMDRGREDLLLEAGWELTTEWQRLPSDVAVAQAVKL